VGFLRPGGLARRGLRVLVGLLAAPVQVAVGASGFSVLLVIKIRPDPPTTAGTNLTDTTDRDVENAFSFSRGVPTIVDLVQA
jgi:hypothetical protein